MRDYSKDSDKLYSVMKSKAFLQSTSIGGETPTYVYAYEIEASDIVDDMLSKLEKKLELDGIKLYKLDLFEAFTSFCNEAGYLDFLLEAEETTDKEEFLENIQGIAENSDFISYIGNKIENEEYDIFVLTGAGKAYPLLRAHSLLENLQTYIKRRPFVLFFPGEYIKSTSGGIALNLFGKLPSDGYYRAFDIIKEV